MIQLGILSGKLAGTNITARHFPFYIGRAADADLQLQESGIWDQHLQLSLDPVGSFVVTAATNTLAAVNGQPISQAPLHNGDILEIGAIKIRFWIGPVRQRALRVREWLLWAAIVAIVAAQIALIYWLLL